MHFLNDIVEPSTYCEITRNDGGFDILYTKTPGGEKIMLIKAKAVAYSGGKMHATAETEIFGTRTEKLEAFARTAARRVLTQYISHFSDPIEVKVIFMRTVESNSTPT